jgi:hypothetical protein
MPEKLIYTNMENIYLPLFSSGNILSQDRPSSSWMPIHAPEGAVPARAYEIAAPDLSRGSSHFVEGGRDKTRQTADYIQGQDGRVSVLPVSHANRYLSWPDSNTYRGNAEEVVSAVVLVKQN